MQHLTTLLASCDMQVVLSVLNLLYVFSKRSNYITRLGSDKRTPLLARLQHLAEVWQASRRSISTCQPPSWPENIYSSVCHNHWCSDRYLS